MKRRLFRWFTVLLLATCIWTAYANVLSDDTEVRAKARAALGQAAGCADDCKIENLRGDRGMLETRIEYDLVRRGHYVVTCRRAFLVLGDHDCVVDGGKSAPAAASSQ